MTTPQNPTRGLTLYYCDHHPHGYLAKDAGFCTECLAEPKPEMGVLPKILGVSIDREAKTMTIHTNRENKG